MIILTSSVASVAGHIYQNYLSDKDYKTILFIDTAAEAEIGKIEGDDDWLRADLKSLRDQGYQVDRWSITDKTKEEIDSKLEEYDVIYMCGGDTKYLLSQMQQTKSYNLFIDKVRAGKPYIGTSAGSIIAGRRLPDYFHDVEANAESNQCLNLVNFTLIPHWGSEHFKDVYVSRTEISYKDTQEPLLLLTDSQYVHVDEDGRMIIENT